MTNQEFYNKVITHLIQQGRRSLKFNEINEFSECAYRGQEGRKCAIGIFIPDDKYSLDMEDKTLCMLLSDNSPFNNALETLKGVSRPLMTRMQQLHDFPENWDNNGFSLMGMMNSQQIAMSWDLTPLFYNIKVKENAN